MSTVDMREDPEFLEGPPIVSRDSQGTYLIEAGDASEVGLGTGRCQGFCEMCLRELSPHPALHSKKITIAIKKNHHTDHEQMHCLETNANISKKN